MRQPSLLRGHEHVGALCAELRLRGSLHRGLKVLGVLDVAVARVGDLPVLWVAVVAVRVGLPPSAKERRVLDLAGRDPLGVLVQAVTHRVLPGGICAHAGGSDSQSQGVIARCLGQRHHVPEFTVGRGVQLVIDDQSRRQAFLSKSLRGEHPVHRARRRDLNRIPVQLRLLGQVRGHLHHLLGSTKHDARLVPVSRARINLAASRTHKQAIERDARAQSRLAVLTRQAHNRDPMTQPLIRPTGKQVVHQLALPRPQHQRLASPATHRVFYLRAQRLNELSDERAVAALDIRSRNRGQDGRRPALDLSRCHAQEAPSTWTAWPATSPASRRP